MAGGEKTVGVIGGMGPEATVEFLRRVVMRTPAQDDADHLHILVDNNPKIPSRIAALIDGTGADPTPVLCRMAQGLAALGAHFLVMPCNTAHHYLPAIAASVRVPILDMVQLSIGKLAGKSFGGPRRIGLLASPAVRMVGLYKTRLEQAGLEAIFPDAPNETRLLGVIKAVKAGKHGDLEQSDYIGVAQHLRQAGAEALLIACTELSVLAPPDLGVPVVDTLDVLVEATISAARE